MKTKPHGVERGAEFLRENYICIGWPGIGDLTHATKDIIRERLAEVYKYEGQQLSTYLGFVNTFVRTMQEGDYVLISENEYVHLGIIGPYKYVEEFDNDIDGKCHQRKVNWLVTVQKSDLNAEVQELLRNRGTVTQFKHPIAKAELDRLLNKNVPPKVSIPNEKISKALEIVYKAMESENEELRLKAAAILLNYIK
jgi:predicted Mrr-cat superfamily restriction endonuclease